MKTTIELIQEERTRQVEVEGFSANSDDRYTNRELAKAAGAYLLIDIARQEPDYNEQDYSVPDSEFWPWGASWWKPSPDNPIKELVKAGALIVAEIERLQRLEK